MNERTAVVAGASGLVGGHLLHELLVSPHYSRVTVLVRKRLSRAAAKLRQVVVEFDKLERAYSSLEAADAFCCLGTTRAKAGSAEAFRRVDFDAVVDFARLSQGAGAKQFLLVSSSGANAKSPFLYPRVKGEAEDACAKLPFAGVQILRPSLLLGERAESRPLERLAQTALRPLLPLLGGPLGRVRPIEASVVARALVRRALVDAAGVHRLENEAVEELGRA
jgi:uncharacterized protein YbjT (DUF2867 family)